MPPNTSAVQEEQKFRAELNTLQMTLAKLKTGNWRIPPHGDPLWKQVQEINKAFETLSKTH